MSEDIGPDSWKFVLTAFRDDVDADSPGRFRIYIGRKYAEKLLRKTSLAREIGKADERFSEIRFRDSSGEYHYGSLDEEFESDGGVEVDCRELTVAEGWICWTGRHDSSGVTLTTERIDRIQLKAIVDGKDPFELSVDDGGENESEE